MNRILTSASGIVLKAKWSGGASNTPDPARPAYTESDMPSVSPCPPSVQAQYTPPAGIVLRINGKSRLAAMDEIEQDYSQAQLDEVLSRPGMWVKLTPRPVPSFPSTHTCRCWAAYRGDTATIILPTIGKVVISRHDRSRRA